MRRDVMHAPVTALIRMAAAVVVAPLVSILVAAEVSAQTAKTPVVASRQPNQGLRSVAERSEQDWHDIHAMFTKEMTRVANACDPALKQALETAQSALNERTRAWTEFYTQQGHAADEYQKAAAAAEVQEEATARTAETDIASLTKDTTELKRRKEALIAGGTDGLDEEAVARAIRDLDELINLRQQTITVLNESIAIARRTVVSAQAVQTLHGNAVLTAAAFGELIRAQHKLYAALYRGREMRLALECGPIKIKPPSKLPPLH